MGLVSGPTAAGNDVDGEDEDDGDDGEQPEPPPAPQETAQPTSQRRAPRSDAPLRGAVAANSLLRQLRQGEQLLVERIGGQGARGFLCTIDVDGPMRWPDDLATALQQRGHAAIGELELVLCDPSTGRLITRVITPVLSLAGAPAPAAFGATGGAVPHLPATPGGASSELATILSAMLQSNAQMTAALASAVTGQRTASAGGGGEAVEILRAELAKRDADIKALREEMQELANRDDGDDDGEGPMDAVDQTVGAINKLQKSGLLSGTAADVATAAVTADGWADVLKVAAPGVVTLLQQIAHEVGQISRMRLAIDAERAGIKVSEVPQAGLPAPAPGSSSTGGGAAGGGA